VNHLIVFKEIKISLDFFRSFLGDAKKDKLNSSKHLSYFLKILHFLSVVQNDKKNLIQFQQQQIPDQHFDYPSTILRQAQDDIAQDDIAQCDIVRNEGIQSLSHRLRQSVT